MITLIISSLLMDHKTFLQLHRRKQSRSVLLNVGRSWRLTTTGKENIKRLRGARLRSQTDTNKCYLWCFRGWNLHCSCWAESRKHHLDRVMTVEINYCQISLWCRCCCRLELHPNVRTSPRSQTDGLMGSLRVWRTVRTHDSSGPADTSTTL